MNRLCRNSGNRSVSVLPIVLLLFAGAVFVSELRGQGGYRLPSKEIVELVDAPLTPLVSVTPDYQWLLQMERASLPSIEEVSEPESRIAGLRINPRTRGRSRESFLNGLRLKRIGGDEEKPIAGIPAGGRISNIGFSPDGTHLAFTLTQEDRIELWVAPVETAKARRLLEARLNAAVARRPCSWVSDSRTLVCTIVPSGQERPPAPRRTPAGPILQESTSRRAPARTYQDLLKSPFDEQLFDYYGTSQIIRVGLDGATQVIGRRGIHSEISLSPDGKYLLVETIHRPYSYLVPRGRFPYRVEVWNFEGNVVKQIADLPLAENVPVPRGSVPTGPRNFGWRADVGAELYWTEAQDGGDAGRKAEVRDKVFTLAAPFDGEPRSLATLGLRFAGVRWANDDLALVSEFWWQTRRRRTWRVRPGSPEADPEPVFDYSTEDRYNNPGTPLMRPNPWGKSVLFTDENGDAVFLRSQGASPEGNRPFLDKYSLSRKESVRLCRSEAPLYEWPFVMIDAKEGLLVTRRESVDEPPNYFLRKLGKDEMTQLTRIPHPTPKLKGLHKELIRYKRADGVELSGMLYLPPGKKPEDGPFPVLMWAYPREYKSAASAGQVRRSPYRFTRISPTSSLIYLAAGYAIFNDPIMPIIGEGEKEPNDSYVEQLVSSAEAAVDELVERRIADRKRIAIAGHSYGAFMVANLLAHSDVFATGVARSGAYNRTLTPFGFQAEQRTF